MCRWGRRLRDRWTRGNAVEPRVKRRMSLAPAEVGIARLDPEGTFTPADWSNLNQVNKAWRKLIEKIERELAIG